MGEGRTDVASGADVRRSELAAFLRSRRERIAPEDVGLPAGQRRRTSGLRREEVAQLAGVGITWYTWLEQGRPIHASPQVLDAVARTLQLDAVERQHLFRLAEALDDRPAADIAPPLAPEIQPILDQLSPLPAYVLNERFDVLAFNAGYAALFPRVRDTPPSERNTILNCFASSPCCSAYENSAGMRAALVAQLRAAYGRHVGEPAWTGFIKKLEAASAEFAQAWATHDVAVAVSVAKVFRHPLYPRLPMTSTSLALQGCIGTRMVVYTADDAETRRAMAHVVADGTDAHFPCWESHQARQRELALRLRSVKQS
jgi:transcriptional regulator with XRE-family HTH domain